MYGLLEKVVLSDALFSKHDSISPSIAQLEGLKVGN